MDAICASFETRQRGNEHDITQRYVASRAGSMTAMTITHVVVVGTYWEAGHGYTMHIAAG